MKKQIEILNNLTAVQKAELEKDMQQLYSECYQKTKGNISLIKDATVNMNLNDEVFLKITFEFDSTFGEKGKGRITSLYQYPNKLAYEAGVSVERNMN